MVQWIRPGILNRKVHGSNLLAAAVVPFVLSLGKDLKPSIPWLLAYTQLAFLVAM